MLMVSNVSAFSGASMLRSCSHDTIMFQQTPPLPQRCCNKCSEPVPKQQMRLTASANMCRDVQKRQKNTNSCLTPFVGRSAINSKQPTPVKAICLPCQRACVQPCARQANRFHGHLKALDCNLFLKRCKA